MSGKLGFDEFKKLWQDLRKWKVGTRNVMAMPIYDPRKWKIATKNELYMSILHLSKWKVATSNDFSMSIYM